MPAAGIHPGGGEIVVWVGVIFLSSVMSELVYSRELRLVQGSGWQPTLGLPTRFDLAQLVQ